MLLAIDVGNTETKLGCFAEDTPDLLHAWRVTTDARRTADEYGVFFAELFATAELRPADVQAVIIASVVPRLDQTLHDACRKTFNCTPAFFKAHDQHLMPVLTERPEEVGADLVATAIGGRELYGVPLIIVSYGTATVFMAISAKGEYLGVAIAPGINLSIDALIGGTAKLPQVSLTAPECAIGRDTIAALQSGIIFGFIGQTEALVSRMRNELGVDAPAIATGGMADAVAKNTTLFHAVSPHLSLLGLRKYYSQAHPSTSSG